MRTNFDSSARAIARECVLNVDDIRNAYRDKPDSLTELFNVMAEGKKQKEGSIACAVIAALCVVTIPLIPIPLNEYFQGRKKLAAVKKAVYAEIGQPMKRDIDVPALIFAACVTGGAIAAYQKIEQSEATKDLARQGFTHIEVLPFDRVNAQCPVTDFYGAPFTATDSQGRAAQGSICRPLFSNPVVKV